ncbi:MAG: ABC transporter permease [Verrucomicrobiota bacterium]
METWINNVGQKVMRSPAGFWHRVQFGRAAVAATFRVPKANRAALRSATAAQVWRCGVRQLPLVSFVGLALGVLVIGQAVSLLQQVSAQRYMGTVMVMVVLRELGPLLTAFLVAARPGTAVVVELGALQFAGQTAQVDRLGVRSLRALVAPRVKGLAVAGFCLTIYLIAVALVCGYLMAFVQGMPLRLTEYAGQLADALHWLDFVLIALKAALFGVVIAVVSCYHGLERMLQVEELPAATTRAVVEGLGACVLLDAVFLLGYLIR